MIIRVRISELQLTVALDVTSFAVAQKVYATTGRWYYEPRDGLITEEEQGTDGVLPMLTEQQLAHLMWEQTEGWMRRRIKSRQVIREIIAELEPYEQFMKSLYE